MLAKMDWRGPKSIWYLSILDRVFPALARGGRKRGALALSRRLPQVVSFQWIIRLRGTDYIGICSRIRFSSEVILGVPVYTSGIYATQAGIQDTIFRNDFFTQQM